MRADAAVYMWGPWVQYTHFPPRSHQWGGELQKGAGKSDGACGCKCRGLEYAVCPLPEAAVRVCPVLTLVAGGDCLGSWFSVQGKLLGQVAGFLALPLFADPARTKRCCSSSKIPWCEKNNSGPQSARPRSRSLMQCPNHRSEHTRRLTLDSLPPAGQRNGVL